MTIRPPEDVETSINALVEGGAFASVDAAMEEAARLLIWQRSDARQKAAEEEVLRRLMEQGLIIQVPNRDADHEDPDDIPIAIEGEPLSETIIRERR